ncbi:MAG: formate--phosphoribosylaminoimidazolecarboxamide ligase family protein [Methanomassiliicoccales archaeon]
MVAIADMQETVRRYHNPVIGVIASHSALDVLDGASQEGITNLAVTQRGRDATYARYFKKQQWFGGRVRGIVDEVLMLEKFSDIMQDKILAELVKRNVIFIPNRAFSSYCHISDIEEKFIVPMFGSRYLLRSEEREEKENYYTMLEEAGLPYPPSVEADSIDELVIVKLHHKQKKLERGFFTASSSEEYRRKSDALIKQGVIDERELEHARIEKYIIGPVFNLNFFYSPLEEKGESIELLGIDWRFESSLDGHVRLPAEQQLSLPNSQRIPEYTVVGHSIATLRESLLENAFDMAERYVRVTQRLKPPGIIGPFTLQTCVDKDMRFYIYDVAPRLGGGTNIHVWSGHPYGNSLFNTNMSSGRRIAMEIKRGIQQERLSEIVT